MGLQWQTRCQGNHRDSQRCLEGFSFPRDNCGMFKQNHDLIAAPRVF
jgi:hypothetical protein